MNAQIIPLQVDHCPDPMSFDARFRPREFTERYLKRELLAAVEKYIEITDFDGPYGCPGISARIYLAEGYRSLEQEASRIVEHAHLQAAGVQMELSMWESNLCRKQAELEAAQADFRARFQASLQEFWGYDECAGRA